jgi:hypothetical protein
MESIPSKNSSRNQCLSGIDWRKCEGHTEDDTFFFFESSKFYIYIKRKMIQAQEVPKSKTQKRKAETKNKREKTAIAVTLQS